jgi:hypothetical protein
LFFITGSEVFVVFHRDNIFLKILTFALSGERGRREAPT